MTEILRDPFNDFAAWSTAGTPTIDPSGRTGSAAFFDSGGDIITRTLTAGEQSDTLTFGFAFKVASLAADRALVALRSDAGSGLHNQLYVLTTGALTVTQGSGTTTKIVTSATGLVAINTWYYVEVQIKLHDTTGFVTLRLNNSVVASATNVDTKVPSPGTVYDTFRITGLGTSINSWYDDLYLKVGAGETFNGDIHLGAAALNVWNGSAFVDATAVKVWNGTAFVDATAVKVWNGSAFVDAV